MVLGFCGILENELQCVVDLRDAVQLQQICSSELQMANNVYKRMGDLDGCAASRVRFWSVKACYRAKPWWEVGQRVADSSLLLSHRRMAVQ